MTSIRRSWQRACGPLCRLCVIVVVLCAARTATAAQAPVKPFEITDNSFLVEEAFNQEPGVVQNIFNLRLDRDDQWASTFTQEWPLVTKRHQISYTLPYDGIGVATGLGDISIHYRLQLLDGGNFGTSFSPRATVILPTGSASRGLGTGSAGWEINLPFSRQVGDLFFHWNAGFTDYPSVDVGSQRRDLFTPRVAGSAIWRVRPMVNLMLESLVEWDEEPDADTGSTNRSALTTILPGLRTGWNLDDSQIILGVGVPITFSKVVTTAATPSETNVRTALFVYASYELPFKH